MRILAGVVSVFVVCWTPWNVHSLVVEFFHESVGGPHFNLVDLLLKVCAVGSAAVNPFLYCWLNANFRHVLASSVFKPSLEIVFRKLFVAIVTHPTSDILINDN